VGFNLFPCSKFHLDRRRISFNNFALISKDFTF
jgi:hypothetical protein